MSDVTYEAVWRLFSELLPEKYGIDATFVDVADLDAVRAAIRPRTRLVHVETIANPTTKVADIASLAEIAHGAGQRIRLDSIVPVGGAISPFNAWMIMRGSVTLPLRLKQHFGTAERVAAVLESDPRVAYVAYPGLESHPQHELARKQFGGRGYGAVLAFAVEGDSDAQNRFVNNLRVITSAVSLGHDESLIVHVGPGSRGGGENYPEPFLKYGHLRLSIGLEDPEDLIDDVTNALDETFTTQ